MQHQDIIQLLSIFSNHLQTKCQGSLTFFHTQVDLAAPADKVVVHTGDVQVLHIYKECHDLLKTVLLHSMAIDVVSEFEDVNFALKAKGIDARGYEVQVRKNLCIDSNTTVTLRGHLAYWSAPGKFTL